MISANKTRPAVGFKELEIPGCYEVQFFAHADARGTLVKAVQLTAFSSQGLDAGFKESFYTVSESRVLRGMHVQLPPADHSKLIYCVGGTTMDVFVDLRIGSPAFGQFVVVDLSPAGNNGVYLPPGVAHGFYVREAPAVVVYHVTSEHAPGLDSGVHWTSIGAPWPDDSPLVSPRDAALPGLAEFCSPFTFS